MFINGNTAQLPQQRNAGRPKRRALTCLQSNGTVRPGKRALPSCSVAKAAAAAMPARLPSAVAAAHLPARLPYAVAAAHMPEATAYEGHSGESGW